MGLFLSNAFKRPLRSHGNSRGVNSREVRFFLVITRDHGSFGGRHQVEILPTGLPELFKPARDLLEPRKFENLGPKFSS